MVCNQTKGDNIKSGCLTPAFWKAQKRAGLLCNPCILGDRQTKGDNIRIGSLTPAFSGAQKRAEMLRHPYILGDPQTTGDQIRIGCLTPAFLRAQKRAEMLCHPCILGDPQTKVDKSKVAASPLPARGPKRGRKCYVTDACSGIPKEGGGQGKIRSGYLSPACSGAQKRAKMLGHPCVLGSPQTKRIKSEMAASRLPPRGAKRGRKCYVTTAFSGIPKPRGIKSEVTASPLRSRWPTTGRKCYVTPAFPKQRGTKTELAAFSGAQNRLEIRRHPYILGGPQTRGQNQKWLPWEQGQIRGYAAQMHRKKFAQMVCLH